MKNEITNLNYPPSWYVIAASHEVIGQKPKAMQRFGLNLVLWRNGGQIVVQEDFCPHRFSKLSLGRIVDNSIECPYHGFKFNNCGNNVYIPELNKASPNLCVQTFEACEKNNFIYINLGDKSKLSPWFDELNNFDNYVEMTSLWDCGVTRCIENQLDFAHLPFIHKTTIGKNMTLSNDYQFILDDTSIKMLTHKNSPKSSYFYFKFGNIWLLNILDNKFAQLLAFVPINDNRTKLYLRTYQNFIKNKFISQLLSPILKFQSLYILNQDKRVITQQYSYNYNNRHEILYPSDEGIKHFRNIWFKSN